MPTLDLRDRNDLTKLKPLAHFEVLAVMLHPRSKADRERLMASLYRETGAGKARRAAVDEDQLLVRIEYAKRRGGEAGFLMLALMQLWASGEKPTLHKAIQIIQNELPEWTPWSSTQPSDSHEHLPRSSRKLRKVIEEFGPVAHFWGAALHEQQWDRWRREQGEAERGEVLPISLDRLPRFIGYAEAIRKLYSQLPFKRGDKALIRHPWLSKIPKELHVEVSLRATPLPDDRAELFTQSI